MAGAQNAHRREDITRRLMPPDPEFPGKKLCAGVSPSGGYFMFRLEGVSSDLSRAAEYQVVRPCNHEERRLLRELLQACTVQRVPCEVGDAVVALITAS